MPISPYETPAAVASALARHAPKQFSSVLEPAAGTGALLAPLKKAILRNQAIVTALDIDPEGLRRLRRSFPRGTAKCLQNNFLEWAETASASSFDLIVTNPPFSAKRNSAVDYVLPAEFAGISKAKRRIPIEAAFIICAIRLLRPGGRLLAVLPSSIIAGERLQWLRSGLFLFGSVRYVHELPHGAFPRLEGRTYLFVFERRVDGQSVKLQNHDLARPVTIELRHSQAATGVRLDFAKRKGDLELEEIRLRSRLEWLPLRNFVKIFRGDVRSPTRRTDVIHSNASSSGLWRPQRRAKARTLASLRQVTHGDLLMQRVGRGCARSAGLGRYVVGLSCSDCVWLLRPNSSRIAMSVLFAMRTVLQSDYIRGSIQRGIGASYISLEALGSLCIPYSLYREFPNEYKLYRKAWRNGDLSRAMKIEEDVWRSLSCAE